MRLKVSESIRRTGAVVAWFKKSPKASVAKMNAALTSGAMTGQPERMLNIATGYKLRHRAILELEAEAVTHVANPKFDEGLMRRQLGIDKLPDTLPQDLP